MWGGGSQKRPEGLACGPQESPSISCLVGGAWGKRERNVSTATTMPACPPLPGIRTRQRPALGVSSLGVPEPLSSQRSCPQGLPGARLSWAPSGPLLIAVMVPVRAKRPGNPRAIPGSHCWGRVGSGHDGCGTSGKSRGLWGGVRPALPRESGVSSCSWQASQHLVCRVRSRREAVHGGHVRAGIDPAGACLARVALGLGGASPG